MMRTTIVALAVVALMASAASSAATPKPWQWTPARAASELVSENPPIPWIYAEGDGLDVARGSTSKITAASCQPRGTRFGKLYAAFRCSATWKSSALSVGSKQLTLYVKVRKVAKPTVCVSLQSLAAVPAGCVATMGLRSPGASDGRSTDALKAMAGKPLVKCWGYGSGFYGCWTPDTSYWVTVTPSGPLVVPQT